MFVFILFMNIKTILIGIGVIILTSFVVIYGFGTFYPEVKHEDFCPQNLHLAETESSCISMGGIWNSFNYPEDTETTIKGLCDQPRSCWEDMNEAREARSKWIFIISIPLAILLIVIGALVFSLESVGAGLMGGAVVTLIYGGILSFIGSMFGNFLKSRQLKHKV